ncbi:hypothetical protein DMA15_22930 [Streptomyces sp. WAC 01529]|uniref:hypothetical protein n=1 Tax=Streptomyces sp. WAC 01529 TaxID=2203205 RepID=UPI000F701488|nr:hypothetical protein [Streptomyces sp. WAC 01529]AZM55070.1 hypothetical protein DMA15_22930 [Streptomyces sp. WAC 01529]
MADEQDKWLDRDAAERLLRGEPLEGVDPHARAQADRLAQALGALAATDGPAAPGESGATTGELPGEAAALAAFRAARADAARADSARADSVREDSAQAGHRSAAYATAAHEAAAAETVRLSRAGGRPRPSRWGGPVRFGLAAALAGCMVGGVAVAAGTGVLPSPFDRHETPGPAASASSAATPEASRTSPSEGTRKPSEELAPDGTAPSDDELPREGESREPPEAEADGGDSGGPTRQPGDDAPPRADGAKDWHRKVLTACRAYRSGDLQGDKRRRLEEFAKGPAGVEELCGRILGGSGAGSGSGSGSGDGQGSSGGNGNNGGDGGGQNGSDGENGGGSGGGDTGGAPLPPPGLPAPVPTASYSALPTLPHH